MTHVSGTTIRENLTLLEERGNLSVKEMVDALGVSKDTVRRDFDCLSQRNLAQRTHGGILPVKNTTVLGFQERQKGLTEDKKKMAVEMLKQTGIPDAENCLKKYPHELSGGMRQRVMIAMALITRPKLLIADEPTTSLDVTIQAQILKQMKELQNQMNMAILLITHDLGIVADVTDKIIVMYAGKIVEEGLCREIFYNPIHPYTKALLESVPRLDREGKTDAENH